MLSWVKVTPMPRSLSRVPRSRPLYLGNGHAHYAGPLWRSHLRTGRLLRRCPDHGRAHLRPDDGRGVHRRGCYASLRRLLRSLTPRTILRRTAYSGHQGPVRHDHPLVGSFRQQFSTSGAFRNAHVNPGIQDSDPGEQLLLERCAWCRSLRPRERPPRSRVSRAQ